MGNPVDRGYEVTRPFTIDIDMSNIEKGIKDWEKTSSAVLRGIELGKLEFAMKLKEKMKFFLDVNGLGNSEIADSIRMDVLSDGIYVEVMSDYAIYVEYGTGVVGERNPHPKAEDGWEYDVNEHGDKGWWYPTTDADPNPKKRIIGGQLKAWTKGQRSRPFMYQTYMWGRRMATKIIKKNINKELSKIVKG